MCDAARPGRKSHNKIMIAEGRGGTPRGKHLNNPCNHLAGGTAHLSTLKGEEQIFVRERGGRLASPKPLVHSRNYLTTVKKWSETEVHEKKTAELTECLKGRGGVASTQASQGGLMAADKKICMRLVRGKGEKRKQYSKQGCSGWTY